ncbi:hypothetical protein WR25_09606 [Diploscapter pachys]|uniref:Uncharacterized protein n=1 Tax=Diploscapter pachys TaxID=2018661 RepID=A0A2A2KG39_9BILA|nr:hypothetical protein WR25_09606 [Diploscapter pachys]
MIEREGMDKAAFSLASAPHGGRELELHVLARESSAVQLIKQLQRNGLARIELPFGDAHLAELPDGPLAPGKSPGKPVPMRSWRAFVEAGLLRDSIRTGTAIPALW